MRNDELAGMAAVVDTSGWAMELPGIGRPPGIEDVVVVVGMSAVLGALWAADGIDGA